MGNIVLLDEYTINKIAAGEVVDRPASIVKELVENSIDAGATQVTVEIKNGGIKYIKIVDNGSGIKKDDVQIAFERHATSKIRKEEDILNITSMGFRGEALASVAGISKVTLMTKNKDEEIGTKYIVEGGNEVCFEDMGVNQGTTIIVENVFYNVPARYKFLKKDYTEAGYIEDVMTRLALVHPEIAFKYINNGKSVITTTGDGKIDMTIYSIFGKDTMQNIIPVNYEYEGRKITGVIGNPKLARSTRQYEFTYINNRFVKDKMMSKAIEDAFEQALSIGKFPFAVINVSINPSEVDVNVHPAKLEVKFQDESAIYSVIYHGVRNAVKSYEESISPFREKTISNMVVYSPYSSNEYNPVSNEFSVNEEIHTYTGNSTNINNISSGEINEAVKTYESYNESPVIQKVSETNIKPNNDLIGQYNLDIEEAQEKINEVEKSKINYKFVGNVFNTYIIIEINDRMYIIDQHAAHERLLYERIKANYYSKSRETQMLLIPTLVELKNGEKELVDNNKEMFENAGFIIEDFGDNGIKISGIPNVGYDLDYKEMFLDGVDELMGASKTTKEEKEKRFLATLACKAAVKGNMNISKEEQISLLDEMMKLDNPFTCPHGRPTAYELSKYEIERRFLRK